MPSRSDPEAARKLIAEVIDSFEKLEIIVHVFRGGYAPKTPAELAKALSIPPDEVEKCMQVLTKERVLDPAGPWAQHVEALVTMYDDDRLEVLNLMTKTALARVRKEAARVFADAFVIRPKKKGDSDA